MHIEEQLDLKLREQWKVKQKEKLEQWQEIQTKDQEMAKFLIEMKASFGKVKLIEVKYK